MARRMVKRRKPDELTEVVRFAAKNSLGSPKPESIWSGIWQVWAGEHPELAVGRKQEYMSRVKRLREKLLDRKRREN